jgi:hypothetical protein
VTVLAKLGEDTSLIETPRYAAFTDILVDLAQRQRDVLEIAGNHVILVTLMAQTDIAVPGADTIFAHPIQSRPGWQRYGKLVPVPALTRTIREIAAAGALFEHVYDY